ncbi:hypothetical protein DVH05_028619 [Phytophthora capsici]|nr:hypothetical protein DVH05_028619 [Phytophthora capsici]KAG1709940.1 hypothetical protein DVH05_028619 [Phytophthora capsici]
MPSPVTLLRPCCLAALTSSWRGNQILLWWLVVQIREVQKLVSALQCRRRCAVGESRQSAASTRQIFQDHAAASRRDLWRWRWSLVPP